MASTKKIPFLNIGGESVLDDTVLTVATAYSILNREDYGADYKKFFSYYPEAGYGPLFRKWAARKDSTPYNSCGNGSAMRVSPVGFAFDTLEEVLLEAGKSAAVSHNHPEGIKGAQATATAIFLARKDNSKKEIRDYIEKTFEYNLNRSFEQLRKHYTYSATCQGTVPESIIVFLESENYEDAVRKAISIGGDSDTIACITGGIAQAFYKHVPEHIENKVFETLDTRLAEIIREFTDKFPL